MSAGTAGPVSPRTPPSVVADVSQRSFGELLGEVTDDLSTLLRQEVELAKAEARQEAVTAAKAGGLFGGAAVAGHLTLVFISLAVAAGLANVMDAGWAALIVAVLWAAVAAILYSTARSRARQLRGLPRTIETAKEIPNALRPEGGVKR